MAAERMALCPSDKALDAATLLASLAIHNTRGPDILLSEVGEAAAAAALNAAHNPALGLDRSVCLRDLVGLLRAEGDPDLAGGYCDAADFIEFECALKKVDSIERTFTKTEEQP